LILPIERVDKTDWRFPSELLEETSHKGVTGSPRRDVNASNTILV